MSYFVAVLESSIWVCPDTKNYKITARGGRSSDGNLGDEKVVLLTIEAGERVEIQVGRGGHVLIEDVTEEF